MLTFEEILSHFPGRRVSNGTDGFLVPCPVHAETKPSLSISPGNGSGVIFYDFGGCKTEDILTAKGLTWQDVLPPREESKGKKTTRKPSPVAAPRTPGKITRYEIRDAAGNLEAVHVRKDFSDDDKKFHWELPDGTRSLGGRKLETLPLYGIEKLSVDAKEIIIAEGEKATDALLQNGIAALGTVTGAAGTPGDDALRPLLSRPVYLWRDNDDPGREHMKRIGAALLRLGHMDVRAIEWKGAPEKGDAADLFQLEGAMDDFHALLDEARAIEPTAKKPAPPLFESLATLLLNPRRPQWLVQGLIETPATVLAFGPSGGGKTFITVDLAGAGAINGQWAGRGVIAPGPVFYLAGEGKTGLLRRFHAWQLHHKVTIPPDRLFLSTSRIELDEIGAIKVEQAVADCTKESGVSPSLIVVDTLARSLPSGADENSAKDIGAFVNIVDRIRDRFNCVVLIVHHTGHQEDKRARGSSSLKAAMDVELRITNRAGARVAEWTKLKDLPEEPHPQEFILERVLVSAEEDGELVTSAVVSWRGTASASSSVRTTKTEDLGMKTLRTAIEAGVGFSTTIEAWRPVFYSQHWGDNDEAKKKAFSRMRESLVSKGLIRIDKGQYSITGRTA